MSVTEVIRLHRAQHAFRHSQALYRGFVGGISSGKSFVTCYDLIRRAKPGRFYMYVCPTYKMLRRADLRSLLELARQLRFLKEFQRGEMLITLGNGAEIACCSAEDPDSLRGPNASGVVLCEASLMHRDAFDICIGRLRENGEQGWLSAGFTPKGRQHWTFDTFGPHNADTALFQARTQDNPFNPPGFADTLRKQYTTGFAEQELEGQYVDLSGTVARREWFKIVDAIPQGGSRVRAWDLAASEKTSADWTVGVLLSLGARVTVEHVVREQTGPAGVEALILQTAKIDGPSIPIVIEQEGGASGKIASASLVRQLAGYNVTTPRPSADKITRAMPLLAQAQAGNVDVYRSTWTAAYIDEWASFSPTCAHDDQCDATSSAFAALAKPTPFVAYAGKKMRSAVTSRKVREVEG
jgi:predicted phage terminase large subunit-like protein